jgi:capsular polysaccharide biosynthesis protein
MARHPVLIAVTTIAVAAAAYLIARVQEPRYRATARVFLVDPNRELGLDVQRPSYLDPRRNTRTKAEIALSGPVLREVARKSGLSVDQVRDHVDSVPVSEADIFNITAVASTPAEATRLVSLTQRAYADVSRQVQEAPFKRALADMNSTRRRLEHQLASAGPDRRATLRTRIASLSDKEAELRSNSALLSSGVQAYEQPAPPEAPVSPRPLRSAAVGAMLGFMAAIAFLWFRAGRRLPASRPDLAAARLGAPLLVELPQRGRPWEHVAEGEIEDAYRRLAHAVAQRARGAAVVVTAARAEDLNAAFPERLAAAAVALGATPLLVDGDPLGGRQRPASAPGAWDVALGEAGEEAVARLPASAASSEIAFLPAGASAYRRASDSRSGEAARLAAIFRRFDPVIIAAPALETVIDSRMPPLPAGTTAIVLTGPETPLRSLWELRSRLDVLGLRLVGFVFDNGA